MNDTYGNVNSSAVNFTISAIAPAVTINFPTNGLWLNYKDNVGFNVTALDGDGFNNCSLWTNSSDTIWKLNKTKINIQSKQFVKSLIC